MSKDNIATLDFTLRGIDSLSYKWIKEERGKPVYNTTGVNIFAIGDYLYNCLYYNKLFGFDSAKKIYTQLLALNKNITNESIIHYDQLIKIPFQCKQITISKKNASNVYDIAVLIGKQELYSGKLINQILTQKEIQEYVTNLFHILYDVREKKEVAGKTYNAIISKPFIYFNDKTELSFYYPCMNTIVTKQVINSNKQTELTLQSGKKEEEISDFYKIKSKTKYFVLHTAHYEGKTTKQWAEKHKGKDAGVATGYIWGDGSVTWLPNKSLEEEFGATKQEYEQKTTTPINQILGTMIHIEMNYDCRNNGHPAEIQYKQLAQIYYNIYKKNGRKLIIVSHNEVDRGITMYKGKKNPGHTDPWNFDLQKFYNILRDTYDITIIEGVDGLTIERFKQVTKSTNKIHWPPVLKGPVEND